jgi:hypothetical protein
MNNKKVATPPVYKYRPTKCKNCGYDIKGLYGSDRAAHRDGWCNNL